MFWGFPDAQESSVATVKAQLVTMSLQEKEQLAQDMGVIRPPAIRHSLNPKNRKLIIQAHSTRAQLSGIKLKSMQPTEMAHLGSGNRDKSFL